MKRGNPDADQSMDRLHAHRRTYQRKRLMTSTQQTKYHVPNKKAGAEKARGRKRSVTLRGQLSCSAQWAPRSARTDAHGHGACNKPAVTDKTASSTIHPETLGWNYAWHLHVWHVRSVGCQKVILIFCLQHSGGARTTVVQHERQAHGGHGPIHVCQVEARKSWQKQVQSHTWSTVLSHLSERLVASYVQSTSSQAFADTSYRNKTLLSFVLCQIFQGLGKAQGISHVGGAGIQVRGAAEWTASCNKRKHSAKAGANRWALRSREPMLVGIPVGYCV